MHVSILVLRSATNVRNAGHSHVVSNNGSSPQWEKNLDRVHFSILRVTLVKKTKK